MMNPPRPGHAARLADATMELTRTLYRACATPENRKPDLRSEVVYFFSMALAYFFYKPLKEAQPILREFMDLGVRGYFDVNGPRPGAEADEAMRERCRGLFRGYLKALTDVMDHLAVSAKGDKDAAEKGQLAFVIRRVMEFHVEKFDKMPSFEMVRQTGLVIFSLAPRLVYESVVIADQQVLIDLPESWKPVPGLPPRYRDPATPQYNFIVSALPPAPATRAPIDIARGVVAGNQGLASGAQFTELGPSRALAQYRTALPGEPAHSEQYSWLLVELESGQARTAVFTFSVLANQSEAATTQQWVQTLRERIANARFSGASPAAGARS